MTPRAEPRSFRLRDAAGGERGRPSAPNGFGADSLLLSQWSLIACKNTALIATGFRGSEFAWCGLKTGREKGKEKREGRREGKREREKDRDEEKGKVVEREKRQRKGEAECGCKRRKRERNGLRKESENVVEGK